MNEKKKTWKVVLIVLVGIFSAIALFVFGLQNFQNKAISYEERIETAASDMNVQYQRRLDLIKTLADAVKSYDKHEAQALEKIAESRGTDEDIQNANTVIKAVAEAYPELKASENYKNFMNEMSITENLIAEYRSSYNKRIEQYNKYVKGFPNRAVLGFLGYPLKEYKRYESVPEASSVPTGLFDD